MAAALSLLLTAASLRAQSPTIEEVAADRTLWPGKVRINKALKAPVIVAGKESGSITFPAGREYPLLSVADGFVLIDVGGTQKKLDAADSNLLEQAENLRQLREAAAKARSAETSVPVATPSPAAASTPPPAAAAPLNALGSQLDGSLVVADGRKLAPFEETLGGKKFIAIYSSASWCGPCRSFTPEFIKWYKRNKSRKDLFEVVFLSADKSADEMQKYMTEEKMPWPAVDYDKRSSSPLGRFPEGGIPGLVVLSAEGEVLSRTYVDGKYVGARKVMDDLDKLVKKAP